jgi:hypothetical protein
MKVLDLEKMKELNPNPLEIIEKNSELSSIYITIENYKDNSMIKRLE